MTTHKYLVAIDAPGKATRTIEGFNGLTRAEAYEAAAHEAANPSNRSVVVWRKTYRNGDCTHRRVKRFLATVALALALIPLATHAMPAYPDSLTTPPVGCVVTHWTPDDYSAMAVCAGGYIVTKEDGPHGAWDDIPYAIGSTRVGPDVNGVYWDWPIWD